MKVFIAATPDVEQKELDDVINLLSRTSGLIQFKGLPKLEYVVLDDFLDWGKSLENLMALSFDELFEICKTYRKYYYNTERISKSDFVVVLTAIPNKNKWFSSFRDNNIFVDINDWEKYTNKDSKFGISYQVIENIFQSLLKLNVEIGDVESEPNIHWHPLGCINDMCQNKRDVILKLRTADICESCQEKFIKEGNSIELGTQIQGILEIIRSGLVRKFLDNGEVIPKKIEVRKVGEIFKVFIEGFDKPIGIEALARTLYVFYLKNLDGVSQYDLQKNYSQIKDLYFKIRRGGDELSLLNLTKIGGDNSFYKEVNYINKALNNLLGEALVEFYLLKKVGDVYKVSITEDYILIDNSL